MNRVPFGGALEVHFREKLGFGPFWTMLGEPWVSFGCLGGSLEGPGSIFHRFGGAVLGTFGTSFFRGHFGSSFRNHVNGGKEVLIPREEGAACAETVHQMCSRCFPITAERMFTLRAA